MKLRETRNKFQKVEYGQEEIQQFFVGLIDAQGSIQCNHWKKRYIQYRITIKIHAQNLEMLQLIQAHFGGSVRKQGRDCLWVEDHQRRIWSLVSIFSKYPPLTSRVQCQLAFLRECGRREDVHWMLAQRPAKFANQQAIRRNMEHQPLHCLNYWPIWSSGFIEGEGCFSLRKTGVASFSISQKGDRYLIAALRDYFGATNSVRQVGDELFLWECYKRSVIKQIAAHCHRYPLIGEKKRQLDAFLLGWSPNPASHPL